MPLTHPLSKYLLSTGEVPGNVLGPWDRVLGDDGLAGELGNRQASKSMAWQVVVQGMQRMVSAAGGGDV